MLFAKFTDGTEANYSRTLEMFRLLSTDKDTLYINDGTTGEILYDKENHYFGSGINDLK